MCAAAWRSRSRRPRRPAARSRRRRSASSTCSWPAARRRWRRSTTSRCSTAQRRAAARLGPPGTAAHRHVGQPVVAAAGRLAVRVRAARPGGAWVSESAAPHRGHRRRPLHRPIDVHRGDQPRPGDHVLPDRLADRRPAEHGRVAALRPRQRQRRPAGVRRADHAGQSGPAAVRAALGQRLPASRSIRACSSAAARTPCCISRIPTASRARAGGCMLDRLRRAAGAMRPNALGDPEVDARIAQYEMAYRMQTSVPGVMDLSNEPRSDVRAVRPGRANAGHVRRQLPAGPPAGRARRASSSSSITRAGTSTATCRAASSASAARPIRRAPRSSSISSSAACSTTRSSSGAANSAARSYSQGKLTATNYGRDHHPRCFTHLDGRRRRQGRLTLRRDRRLRLQRRRRTASTSTTSTRRCCICSASITSA